MIPGPVEADLVPPVVRAPTQSLHHLALQPRFLAQKRPALRHAPAGSIALAQKRIDRRLRLLFGVGEPLGKIGIQKLQLFPCTFAESDIHRRCAYGI